MLMGPHDFATHVGCWPDSVPDDRQVICAATPWYPGAQLTVQVSSVVMFVQLW